MSRFISSLLALVLLLSSTAVAIAQEVPEADQILTTINTGGGNPSSPLSCFDFYDFNSVAVSLEPSVADAVSGSPMTFFGSVTNQNPYPLTDVTLMAKVFRVNEELVQQGNGNELVDYFEVEKDIVLNAGEIRELTLDWQIPNNAPGGNYFLTVFVLDNDFAVSGLAFSDDVYANTSYFSVVENNLDSVYLNKNGTTLNGETYQFVDFPPSLTSTESVVVSTELVNPTDAARNVPLQWKQYSFDASKESNFRNVKTEVVRLEPGETRVVSYIVKEDRAPVVFLSATTEDRGLRSILHMRYIQADKSTMTRLSFAGLSSFPLNQESTVTPFVCAHTTGETVSQNKITTTLIDNYTNEEIYTYTYEGDIDGMVGGYGEAFVPTMSYDNVTLMAKIEQEGVVVESTEVVYNCQDIAGVDCMEREAASASVVDWLLASPLLFYGLIGVLLLLLFLVWSVHKRHQTGPNINVMNTQKPISSLLFLLFLPAFLLLTPTVVLEAKTASVTGTATGDPGTANGISVQFEADYTVLYHATLVNQSTGAVITDGATIPAGTVVELRPATRAANGTLTSDVHYTFTGEVWGTPNGSWNSPNWPGNLIGGGQGLGCGGSLDRNYNVFTTFYVDKQPESFSLSGVPATELSPGVYRLDGAGAATASVQYPGTTGTWRFYNRATTPTYCGDSYPNPVTKNISARAINFNFNVSVGNNPPNTPNISGPTSGAPNTNHTFTINATDSDGDTLRYGVDRDNNGSVDVWVPATGFVNSGTNQNTTRNWGSNGSYTFQVLAQDSNGLNSAWASHTINITSGPTPPTCSTANIERDSAAACQAEGYDMEYPQKYVPGSASSRTAYVNWSMSGSENECGVVYGSGSSKGLLSLWGGGGSCPLPFPTVDLTINGSDGPLSVSKNDSLALSWTSSNAGNCTLYGAGLPGGSVAVSGNTTVPANAITSSPESYVLSCDGEVDSVDVTVTNQPPNAPVITGPNTGEAGQSYTFNFRATDDDGDSIAYEIDWDNDGVVNVTAPGSGNVPSGTTVQGNRQWNADGSYTFQARTVDFDNARSGWTQHTIVLDEASPTFITFVAENTDTGETSDTALTIGAQDDVTLTWTSDASTCSAVAGSGFAAGSASGSDDTINEPSAGSSDTFTIDCGGLVRNITLTSELADLSITGWNVVIDENSFDQNTATYSNGTVNFTHSNVTSRSAVPQTTATLDYNGGRTASAPGLNGGQEYSGQVSIPITNIPLGGFTADLTVNQPQSVNEKTRANNTVSVTTDAPPPNPGLFITANRIQVRPGESVTLEWGASVIYPMDCEVEGPGVNRDPASLPGTAPTGPVTAKSEYILSCLEQVTNTSFEASVIVETVGTLEEV